jgi:cytoplasmic iron level regulating protein YaaA (DUF328/UPF0246 family)
LVLLPPSETKSDGGTSGPLDVAGLWLPELNAVRERLVSALVELAGEVDASRAALRISARQDREIERNAQLRNAPTMPALRRYTGVLYDALDAESFTKTERAAARQRLAIGSALFGVVRAGDLVPAYRLSGGSTLPELPTLRALWRKPLSTALGRTDGLVVDLRSGTYQQLGPVPGAVAATVVTERPDGSRAVVSQQRRSEAVAYRRGRSFAGVAHSYSIKHHKGLLARALATSRAEPDDVDGVARVADKAGLRVEVSGPTELTVLTD